MKFTIHTKNLATVLNRVQSIASGRATMQVLANVLLLADACALHLFATDLEVGFTTVIDGAAIDTPGRITLPAKKLHEIINAIPTEEVTIALQDADRVSITGGSAYFNLAGLPADEFPDLPPVTGDHFDLDAGALFRILGHVDYCMSKDETKYNLCGVYLRLEEREDLAPRLTAVATDGHRLAIDSIALPGSPRDLPKDLLRGVIVPRKGVAEIKKLSSEGILVMKIAGNNLCIETKGEKLFLRLVDGDFPDYRLVIPAQHQGTVKIKRCALAEAVDRVSIMADSKSKGVLFSIAEGGIAMSSQNAMSGDAADRCDAEVQSEPTERRFNAPYMLQALAAINSPMVDLKLADEQAPITVCPNGETEPMAIIMPMRL